MNNTFSKPLVNSVSKCSRASETPTGAFKPPKRKSVAIGSTDFDQLNVKIVKSQLYYDFERNTTVVFHIITLENQFNEYRIFKLQNEINELIQYITAIYPDESSELTLDKSFELGMKDVELLTVLQKITSIDNILGNLFVKEWFIQSNNLNDYMSLHSPRMSGILYKEGYLIKEWKKKFVLLKDSYLFYFVSEESMIKLQHPRNIINLRNCTVEVNNNTFAITTCDKQVYRFGNDNALELHKWVEAITNTSSLPGTSGIVSLNCITKVKAEGDVIDREREPSPIQRSRSEINRPRGRSASRSRSGSRSPSAQKMQAYEKLVEKENLHQYKEVDQR